MLRCLVGALSLGATCGLASSPLGWHLVQWVGLLPLLWAWEGLDRRASLLAGLSAGFGVTLALFAWLLSLHPTGAGRTYAAYGGVYVASSLLWLWHVEGIRPDRWDWIGAGLCLVGTAVIVLAPHSPPLPVEGS